MKDTGKERHVLMERDEVDSFTVLGSEFVLDPGKLYVTENAISTVNASVAAHSFVRHVSGDWGDVDEEDRAANDRAVKEGGRVLSSYEDDGQRYWILTEADRSMTTILLPEDY